MKLNGENGSLLAVKCDVTNEDEVLSLIKRTREHFGGVDVCINNAGVAHTATFLSGTTENWKDMTNVRNHLGDLYRKIPNSFYFHIINVCVCV